MGEISHPPIKIHEHIYIVVEFDGGYIDVCSICGNPKNTKIHTMTKAGLITTIIVITLGIVDLCFVLFSGTGSSVSAFLVSVGFKDPVVVFAFGFVAGHLFGNFTPVKEK